MLLCRDLKQRRVGRRCVFMVYAIDPKAPGPRFAKDTPPDIDRLIISPYVPAVEIAISLKERLSVTTSGPVDLEAEEAGEGDPPTVGELLDKGLAWNRLKALMTREIHLGPKPPEEPPSDLRELSWGELLGSRVSPKSLKAMLTKSISSAEEGDEEVKQSEVERLKGELEALRARNESLSKSLGEPQTSRRGQVRKDTLRDALGVLLPIVDEIDRLAARPDAESVGILGLRDQALSALGKLGLVGFGNPGEVYDPTRHAAVRQVESVVYDPGTVVEVIQQGFAFEGHVLRPARVAVSSAAASS